MSEAYEYGLVLRPPEGGGVPGGWTSKRSDSKFRHGVVSYAKPLSSAATKKFDMVPLDWRHPANQKAAYEKFYDELLDEFSEKDLYVVEVGGGARYVLHPSTRSGYDFQLTTFDRDTPAGHLDLRDWDAAVKEVWSVLPGRLADKVRARVPHTR